MMSMLKVRQIALLCIALLFVSACGQKRPLYLPDAPEKNTQTSQPASPLTTLKEQ
ncbi:LPS translocon maturation chaperone LptM [Paraglaciecola aestuariivivens]